MNETMRQLVMAVIDKLQARGMNICSGSCKATCNGQCKLVEEITAELLPEAESLLIMRAR